jgi:hypothetical protein
MEFPEELISRNKEIISDIIIKFNQVENMVKEIITEFIDSEKSEFINSILLNNLILNFSSKFKVLQFIIADNKIETDKNFNKSIKILMANRNIIAHSDNILDYDVEIFPVKTYLSFHPVLEFPKYMSTIQKVESKSQLTINDGEIQTIEIEKIYSDFIKYFEIATNELNKIMEIIKGKN